MHNSSFEHGFDEFFEGLLNAVDVLQKHIQVSCQLAQLADKTTGDAPVGLDGEGAALLPPQPLEESGLSVARECRDAQCETGAEQRRAEEHISSAPELICECCKEPAERLYDAIGDGEKTHCAVCYETMLDERYVEFVGGRPEAR